MTKRFSFSLKPNPPACPSTCRCARWRSGSGRRSTSRSAPSQHSRELSQKKRRQKFGGWMCRNNLQIHLGLSKCFEVCILNKKELHLTFYWNPIWRLPWGRSWWWGWWWCTWGPIGRRSRGRLLWEGAGEHGWKISKNQCKEKKTCVLLPPSHLKRCFELLWFPTVSAVRKGSV